MRVVEVVVLVPAKSLGSAKSRLQPKFGPATRGLALAMMLDVVAAASHCDVVAEVAVVTDDRSVAEAASAAGARILADAGRRGLNPALRDAAQQVRSRRADTALLVQPADCPAVVADDFAAVIDCLSTGPDQLFLADKDGSGTTTLAVRPGVPLDPHYGPASRSAHREIGAEELTGSRWERLRLDVDTPDDLNQAQGLGLGRHTSGWLTLLER